LFRPDLYSALLYQPRILVHDPLADYFGLTDLNILPELHSIRGKFANGDSAVITGGPRLWASGMTYAGQRENLTRARTVVDQMLQRLMELAPLVRSGVVVTRSQWPSIIGRKEAILTSSRHDVRDPVMLDAVRQPGGLAAPSWDNLRGMKVTPSGGTNPVDEPWTWQPEFYYLAKTLAFADDIGAVYAPIETSDRRLLKAKIEAMGPKFPRLASGPSDRLLREVGSFLVPDFDLDPKDLVAIRQSEPAFEDWRSLIRDLERESNGLDEADLRQLIADRVGPLVDAVVKATSRSQALKDGARGALAEVVIEAGVGAGVAAVTASDPLVGASAGLVGVARWLWTAFGPPASFDDRRRVVAAMLRGK